jgi:hypothetical protein
MTPPLLLSVFLTLFPYRLSKLTMTGLQPGGSLLHLLSGFLSYLTARPNQSQYQAFAQHFKDCQSAIGLGIREAYTDSPNKHIPSIPSSHAQ